MHKLEDLATVLREHKDFGGVHLNKRLMRLHFDYLPRQTMFELILHHGHILSLLNRQTMKLTVVWDYNKFKPSDLINYFK